MQEAPVRHLYLEVGEPSNLRRREKQNHRGSNIPQAQYFAGSYGPEADPTSCVLFVKRVH